MSHYPGRGAYSNCVIWDVLSDYGSRSDQCVLADRHAWRDCAACPDGRVTLHKGLEKFPFSMRSGMLVIRERHVRRDKHVIFNGHACRNEDEWANLAVVAYRHSFFNIDVRIYFRVLSDLTTVKVHLIKYTRPVADTGLFDDRVSGSSQRARIFSSIGTSTWTVRSWINDSFAASRILTTLAPSNPSD